MKLPKTTSPRRARLSAKTASIANTQDFFRFLDDRVHSDANAIYRGLRKSTYALVPSIGRFLQKKEPHLRPSESG